MAAADLPLKVFPGPFGSAGEIFQHVRSTPMRHEKVVARLEAAVEKHELWVLGKVDAEAFVLRAGYSIGGAVQILAFHPKYMVRLLEADQSALLAAPLKFAVVDTLGGTVAVSWADQAAAFGRYENPKLTELGQELATLSLGIVSEALAGEVGRDAPGFS